MDCYVSPHQNVHYLFVDTLLCRVRGKERSVFVEECFGSSCSSNRQAVSFVTNEIISKPLIE